MGVCLARGLVTDLEAACETAPMTSIASSWIKFPAMSSRSKSSFDLVQVIILLILTPRSQLLRQTALVQDEGASLTKLPVSDIQRQ
jgi:hypothetical protein